MTIQDIMSYVRNLPIIGRLIQRVRQRLVAMSFNSARYWESRYAAGQTSGLGSYGHLAEFKASFLNSFVEDKQISSVIEFGFGDGNQLTMANYPLYFGYDVSPNAVRICRERFSNDPEKSFFLVSEWNGQTADLSISLDVIYHLVENETFERYMRDLVSASSRFLIIYSSDTVAQQVDQPPHVRHRKFSDWLSHHAPEWHLIQHLPNQYPVDKFGDQGSFAEFFVYEKG
jgi:hypothetical protein